MSLPRRRSRRRAAPLLLSAALLCFLPVSTGLPGSHKCPPPSHCKQEGRQDCRRAPPTAAPNEDGRCISELRPQGQSTFFADSDEEIDLLQAAFAQQVTQVQPGKQADAPPGALKSQSGGARHANTAAPLPDTPTPPPKPTEAVDRGGPHVAPTLNKDQAFIIIVSVCVVVGATAVIVATVCYVESQKGSRLAGKADFPSFGGVGVPAATDTSMGDKTLAQSAQMFHYQHRKQQMLSVGPHKPEQNAREAEMTSDEEEVGGDFTVYECPGLAPTGEMEVKNPLFDDSNLHYQGNHK
uniref:Neural proliferation, differentiation and control, 1a n=1 Tax=Tetraodon nigroviridis TaxID=99883 RepID=H3BX54_TETNG